MDSHARLKGRMDTLRVGIAADTGFLLAHVERLDGVIRRYANDEAKQSTHLGEVVVDLASHGHSLGEGRRARGQDHELLFNI